MAIVTADVLIQGPEGVLLIRRKNPPFEGQWALPGGIAEDMETVEEAAIREAKEETGLNVELLGINTVLSKPGRDPRGRTVSIVYDAKAVGGELNPATDAAGARWFKKLPSRIAFDHMEVLDGIRRTDNGGEG